MKYLSIIKTLLGLPFIKETIARLGAESPDYHKKLQTILVAVAGILGVAQALVSAGFLPQLALYVTPINDILIALGGAFGVSLLAKKDPPPDNTAEK